MPMLKILLVDDDPNIRQLVNLYLEKEGFEVTMAARGDEALKLFKESPQYFFAYAEEVNGWLSDYEIDDSNLSYYTNAERSAVTVMLNYY